MLKITYTDNMSILFSQARMLKTGVSTVLSILDLQSTYNKTVIKLKKSNFDSLFKKSAQKSKIPPKNGNFHSNAQYQASYLL